MIPTLLLFLGLSCCENPAISPLIPADNVEVREETVCIPRDEPASLEGSEASLLLQNEQADRENLSRIKNDSSLSRFKSAGLLVPIPQGQDQHILIKRDLQRKWRVVRPWTAEFILNFVADFHAEFGEPVQINSATRTVEYQRWLRRRNRNPNAAPATGPKASPHMTGAAIDIGKIKIGPSKRNMTDAELKWTRTYLLKLEGEGKIEATEEFNQAVFHIMVFRCYYAPP